MRGSQRRACASHCAHADGTWRCKAGWHRLSRSQFPSPGRENGSATPGLPCCVAHQRTVGSGTTAEKEREEQGGSRRKDRGPETAAAGGSRASPGESFSVAMGK